MREQKQHCTFTQGRGIHMETDEKELNDSLWQEIESHNLKKRLNAISSEMLENASVIDVIQVELTRGDGSMDKPARKVFAYFLPSGKYIGEIDPLTS